MERQFLSMETTQNSTAEAPSQTAATALTNKEMAALLFNIATVLRDNGNINPWRTRAYERAARALMGLRTEAAHTLSEGGEGARVPFRRWQHIGKKLHAKIGEMTGRGNLAQYDDLLAGLPPHQAGLMTVPGIGPRMADRIFKTLRISTRPELIRAARNGKLLRVPGMGELRVRAIAALPLPEATTPATFSDTVDNFDEEWNLFSVASASAGMTS